MYDDDFSISLTLFAGQPMLKLPRIQVLGLLLQKDELVGYLLEEKTIHDIELSVVYKLGDLHPTVLKKDDLQQYYKVLVFVERASTTDTSSD